MPDGAYEQGFLDALLVAEKHAERSDDLKEFLERLRYFIELAKDKRFERISYELGALMPE